MTLTTYSPTERIEWRRVGSRLVGRVTDRIDCRDSFAEPSEPVRFVPRPMYCPTCRVEFMPRHGRQKYCQRSCAKKAYERARSRRKP